MAKALEWERQDSATYSWALGLHHYAEWDEDAWQPACMVNDSDIWTGPRCSTMAHAEIEMQKHFDDEIAWWAS